jgi:hypothetical protein
LGYSSKTAKTLTFSLLAQCSGLKTLNEREKFVELLSGDDCELFKLAEARSWMEFNHEKEKSN